jgi:hypothetical protein
MEIQDLRAIYLPDMETESGTPIYTIIKSRDGLHWDSNSDKITASFDLPFIDENWLLMNSVHETDSYEKELFEMDIVEVSGYSQKYFVIIRAGYAFALFDGIDSVVSDPKGEIWAKCKYVCPVWESHTISDLNFTKSTSKIINHTF